ncbi:MAG: hypothetical protein Q9168_005562 [Polycauliona sp. 1 TL-2023]
MERLPSLKKQQNNEDAAAAAAPLDLPRLTTANVASIPSVPGLRRRTMTAAATAGEISPDRRSSRQASIRWRPDPQAPVYQPLNVPPLGMRTHQVLGPIATEPLIATTPSCHDTAGKRAKPSVSRGYKVPSPHLMDRSRGDPVESPAVPIPHASYLAQSAIATMKQSYPQPLLVVLDLNGTLLYRPKASSAYKPRPSLESFLAHCMSNYKILVWSSATPHNVTTICSRIFTAKQRKLLLGEWARDTLDLTATQYSSKVQVYKRLDRIWNRDRIQQTHPDFHEGQRWGQWNTLLLDDSVLKSSAQPYNAVVVPEFTKTGVDEEMGRAEVLGQVVAYLETARTFDNVSSFVRGKPFQVDDQWKWDWNHAKALSREGGRKVDEELGG